MENVFKSIVVARKYGNIINVKINVQVIRIGLKDNAIANVMINKNGNMEIV